MATENKKGADWKRLPDSVLPVKYAVQLKPDMRHEEAGGSYAFEGQVNVEVKVQTEVNEIVLNAADLDLKKATVTQQGAELEGVVTLDKDMETATIKLPSSLKTGSAVLSITYAGTLNDKMKGFYRSMYKDAKTSEPKMMACTQFEATDARRALPCWDEPALKAAFDVTLVVPEGLVAVSNMPVKSEEKLADGLVKYSYDTSPIMSTYLLAFIVGEFDYLEDTDENGVTVRCYTPVGKKEQGHFALNAAVKTLPFYSNYFEIKYPLPKLDMFALPDFAMGAMENWGCVTYRETALLVDEEQSSVGNKQWVALVVAHELAHQWFGNLVTMEWWTHLWLNEGFATWIEYLAVSELFPEWNIWTQFVSMDLGRALTLDAMENSHPVEVDVNHPDEVDEIFDAISYSKGSCVIRMLAAFVGGETFRKSLANYLELHKYKNTFTKDLWDAIAKESGRPVEEIMRTWTKQTGYPVVKVTEGDDRKSLNLEQVRFLSSRPVECKDDDTLWSVPVSVLVAKGGEQSLQQHLLTKRNDTLPVDLSAADWVKLNTNQTGIYRVLYPNSLLEKLVKAIESRDPLLSSEDRLGIQDDAFALTNAGLLDITELFKVIAAFKSETDYTVWSKLSQNIDALGSLLKFTDQMPAFNKFVCSLYKPVLEQVGWDKTKDEAHLTSLLRTVVIRSLGKYGDEETIKEGSERFDRFYAAFQKGESTGSILAPDLRASVYAMVVRTRGADGFNAVKNIYATADLHEERMRALSTLGVAQDEGLLKQVWEFTFSKDVRLQDRFVPLTVLIGNKAGTQLGWDLIQQQWDVMIENFGSSFQLGRIIKALDSFTSEEKATELEAFFKDHEAPAAARAVQQTLESIHSKAAWLKRDFKAIKHYLSSF